MNNPICMIVPGLDNSGPDHWQTLWEARRDDCRRVDLECWSDPSPSHWLRRLDTAVRSSPAPMILVAHSLGCLTVAHWVQAGGDVSHVAGALLVAPPDAERADALPAVRRFAPAPKISLPFPSLVVASRDDPYADFAASAALAEAWGSRLVDVGHCGHINAASRLYDWPEGEALLEQLRANAPRR